jgi:pectate lyase
MRVPSLPSLLSAPRLHNVSASTADTLYIQPLHLQCADRASLGKCRSRYLGTALALGLALLGAQTGATQTQQLAFPGAEGFGRFAKGGRGAEVYHVTNLADAGTGSFRDAVTKPDRTVVFDVGGVINIQERIVVAENLTIAGQTAPGDGITVYGNGLSFSNSNNAIVRYIRIRMGVGGTEGKDAITLADGHDMIFDHVSVSWGRDETFSINGTASNISIQNCIISQGLQTHSAGGLIQTPGGVSILRTLYVDNHTRNPKVKGVNQFVSNVIYNWEVAAYIEGDSDGDSFVNVEDNYFIDGPGTGDDAFTRGNAHFHIYAAGNFQDGDKNGKLDGALIPQAKYGIVTWMTKAYDYPVVTKVSAPEAYALALSQAGASLKRDEVDQFVLSELTSLGTKGKTITNESEIPSKGPGTVKGGSAPADADKDGMPDDWEKAHGLDPANAQDRNGDADKNGYTNLEEYLNNLVTGGSTAMRPVDRTWPGKHASAAQTSGYDAKGKKQRALSHAISPPLFQRVDP